MKRIKNIHDLEYEKLKLRVKQLELEKQMSRTWKHIKHDLEFDSGTNNQNQDKGNIRTGNPLLSGALNYGTSFLSHKLGMIAGKKIESAAELILEKLATKLGTLISKKRRFSKANKI